MIGAIQLPVTLDFEPQTATPQTNFMVVKTSSLAYNVILGRPFLNNMGVVVSSCYLLMKFPTPGGVGQVQGDQRKACTSYVASTKGKKNEETLSVAKTSHEGTCP